MKGKGKFGNFFSNKNPEIGSSSVISTLSSWLQHTIKPLKKVHGYTSYSFKLVSHTHYVCKSSFWFPSSRPLNDFVFFFSWKDVTKCGISTSSIAEVTTDVKFFGLVKPRSTWILLNLYKTAWANKGDYNFLEISWSFSLVRSGLHSGKYVHRLNFYETRLLLFLTI